MKIYAILGKIQSSDRVDFGIPVLKNNGVTDGQINDMMVNNPRRYFERMTKMDITAFYKVTYGLYIISTKGAGCIVNTLTQVTAEPIKMSVAIHKNNITEQQIEKTGIFSAVALAQDAPMKLIGEFGFKSSANTDKFANYKTALDANGVLYVTESTVAQFTLKLVDKLDLGTHVMLIGEVMDAQKLSDAPPLTYEYYQMIKRGMTPKNAPSYKG